MSKTIVVIGVTGYQGASVADTFLALPGWHVRGVSRNPAGDVAQALSAKGVEVVKGDLDDKDSLIAAFKGANVIFCNTDFFIHLFHGLNPSNLPKDKDPKVYGYEREVEQGLNAVEAASSPTVLKTLERFIYSTLSSGKKWSRGKYNGIYHYDSKADVVQQIEERYPEIFSRLSLVQLGHYIQNWTAFSLMAPQKQPDGSFVVIRPFKPTTPMEFVDPRHDTGPVVKALVELPAGKHILAVAKQMTWPEFATLWGEIYGVKTSYKQVSSEEFWKEVPSGLAQELEEAWFYTEEFGHAGGDPDVLRPEEVEPRVVLSSMEEVIQRQDWSSVLQS